MGHMAVGLLVDTSWIDLVRDGRLLDTLERRNDRHRYYSSSGSDSIMIIIVIILRGGVIGDTF